LANSQYATIQEDKGKLYLCMKTVERAHLPSKLWQRVRLSKNYTKALAQVDEHLEFWPKLMVSIANSRCSRLVLPYLHRSFVRLLLWLQMLYRELVVDSFEAVAAKSMVPFHSHSQVHRNKQRLTKMYQYLVKIRSIESKTQEGTRAIREKNSVKRALRSREAKALKAATLDKSIEKELLARLKTGTYGDIYNFPEAAYEKALESAETDLEHEDEDGEAAAAASAKEFVADEDDDEEEDEEENADDDDDDSDDSDDDAEAAAADDDEFDSDDMEDIGEAFATGTWGDNDDDDDDDGEDDDEDDEASSDDEAADSLSAARSAHAAGLKPSRGKRSRAGEAASSESAAGKRGKDAGAADASSGRAGAAAAGAAAAKKKRGKRRGPRVEIEYETDTREAERVTETTAGTDW
jgi:protein MAK16